MDRETRSAPYQPVTDVLPLRITQKVTAVLESAGISNWNLLQTGSHGKVEISGKRLSYLVSGRADHDQKVATISLIDNIGKSASTTDIQFHVTPEAQFVPSGSKLGRLFNRKTLVEDIRLSLKEGTTYSYEAGKKHNVMTLANVMAPEFAFNPFEIMLGDAIGTQVDPAVSGEITLIDQEGKPVLQRIRQFAALNNPELAEPLFAGQFIGAPQKNGQFNFVIEVVAFDVVAGKFVRSGVQREFSPKEEDGTTRYEGKTFAARTVAPLPEPYLVKPKDDETVRVERGRLHSGRIERYLPDSFTHEEVAQMLSNIIEGKIFTVGVWNPLDITGARRVSKKQS